jgi:hypothetical protein
VKVKDILGGLESFIGPAQLSNVLKKEFVGLLQNTSFFIVAMTQNGGKSYGTNLYGV